MKRMILTAFVACTFGCLEAQNSYIVKTKSAKKAVVVKENGGAKEDGEEQSSHDFVGDNFKYYSLCDWKAGMRFMVLPEKYDLVVNTFCDSITDKEVSSGKLRYKIMVYTGHSETPEGFSHVNFRCEDDGRSYYYQIPSGTFDDYCYGKLGVPTLAYLGDVDKAREKLSGATLYTKATVYREDTEMDGEGFREVTVPKNEEVTVKAIGVGTRSFPVKIIVADKKGREFYQVVAMSKTNSGMRDDEFIMDNAKHTFYGAFELADNNVKVASEYAKYIGKNVYTKYATKMNNAAGNTVNVLRLSSFVIKKVEPISNSRYVVMTLQSLRTQELFTKKVTFVNDNVMGDIDGYREDYYGYLFASGSVSKNIPAAHMKAIQAGRVLKGFTKQEVRMAKGDPARTAASSNGRVDWIYSDGSIVKFNKAGRVF